MIDRIRYPEPVAFAENNQQRELYVELLDLTRRMIEDTNSRLQRQNSQAEVAVDEYMILHVTENAYHTHYRWLKRQLLAQGIKVTTDGQGN